MSRVLAMLFALTLLATSARAEQPRCSLPLGECMELFGKMRDRPWMGVEVNTDSVSGARIVRRVVPGSPADRAGVKPGDTLQKIGGVEPQLWFAGKAGWKDGWKDGSSATLSISRAGHQHTLDMKLGHISEGMLAEMIGVHVLEGHLAYMDEEHAHDDHN